MKDTFIEYRIRPVTRYVVTRFAQSESDDGKTGCTSSVEKGEYLNADLAHEVMSALASQEPGDHEWQTCSTPTWAGLYSGSGFYGFGYDREDRDRPSYDLSQEG